jgi:hypothetical protein
MNINKKIIELIPNSKNINDVIFKLGKKSGGGINKKIKNIIEEENLNTSHFIKIKPKPLKYKIIKKTCPSCGNVFETQDGLKHEKFFCNLSCANKNRILSDETKQKIKRKILEKIDKRLHKIPNKNGELIIAKRKEKLEKKCKFCENIFLTYKKNKEFCSQSCASKFSWKNGVYKSIKFSEIQKKAYETGRQKVGGGKTKWFKYKDIKVQGTYELRTCFVLDKMKEENKIFDWEYTKDRIKYIGVDNEEHSYLIDFKIWKNKDDFYYLEVKGRIRENDLIKWDTTRKKGYTLEIWFLKEIRQKEKYLNLTIKNNKNGNRQTI